MSPSEYDSYRGPEKPRRRRRREGPPIQVGRPGSGIGMGRGRGGDDGSREVPMVDDVQFSSYYGRPIVKSPPWGWPISTYLFVGGVAGASGILSVGADLTDRPILRRNVRLTALAALGVGTACLIEDLGKPTRFLYMLRTIKLTSPMSLGTWLLSAYGLGAGVTGAVEVDRLLGERLPIGPLRPLSRALEGPASVQAGLFGGPLAAYTAVLLSSTSVPTWAGGRRDLPFVFVSSAGLAAGGIAMILTPVREAGPARNLTRLSVATELFASNLMKHRMHPVEVEPLKKGRPGKMLKWAEGLTIAGGIGSLFAGKSRAIAVASGLALAASSALTRFAVMDAGHASAKDPKYTVEPQRDRLAARRAAGIDDDSITTAG
ncbi:MAG: polysulfide reductase NrfD [Brachybacterium sp.]|nr:polysulfide reductase NrfD [Brachybacterium sp.]